ncbi:MAG: F-box protein [Gammaproteobacteria bacterium]
MLGKRVRDEAETTELSPQPLRKKFANFFGSFFSNPIQPSADADADAEFFNFSALPTEIQFMIIENLSLQNRGNLREANKMLCSVVDSQTSFKYYDPLLKYGLFENYSISFMKDNNLTELKALNFKDYLDFVKGFAQTTEEALNELRDETNQDLNLVGRTLFYFFGGDSYRLVNSQLNIDSLPKLIEKCEQFDNALNTRVGRIVFGNAL